MTKRMCEYCPAYIGQYNPECWKFQACWFEEANEDPDWDIEEEPEEVVNE